MDLILEGVRAIIDVDTSEEVQKTAKLITTWERLEGDVDVGAQDLELAKQRLRELRDKLQDLERRREGSHALEQIKVWASIMVRDADDKLQVAKKEHTSMKQAAKKSLEAISIWAEE